ncbi:ABC-type multidrug transport system, ATPase component [Planctomycetales bacterium 10988]|nr:ABC-type multidrug transport system, ATPase component [Planctomycetales bacterium 10988]
MNLSSSPLIHCEGIARQFGSFWALRGIHLELQPGTIGLVGNNGAGKSTLIKILLGLLKPTQGKGSILGTSLSASGSTRRGKIGYFPEAAGLVPLLKGVEYVTLAGELCGMSTKEAKRRSHEVLSYVGLEELRYRAVEGYSTGNRQRLKLAAALVHDPPLLLLDEPTGGLDPAGRTDLLQLIEDLIHESGKSVLLSTHFLSDIERLCDQVVFLHHGQVAYAGALDALPKLTSRSYEITYQGENGQTFAEALNAQGVEVEIKSTLARTLRVTVPQPWSTHQFFQLAADSDLLLTRIKPEEEKLEQVFLRHIAEIPDTSLQ